MARTVYFDCFSGVSGDMILGAALDLGLPLESLRAALGSLAIDYGRVSAGRVLRSGIAATRFQVSLPGQHADPPDPAAVGSARRAAHGHRHEHTHEHGHHHPHAHDHARAPDHELARAGDPTDGLRPTGHFHHSLEDIAGYIGRSALTPAGRERAIHLFRRLGEAEAAIHDIPLDRVHLHEVGALDSIIDIVGAVHAMEWLAADRIVASPLNVGSGTVDCAHGRLPVPAPATAKLLAGVPVYAGLVAAELVTPTGALIVSDYAATYGPLPAMRLESTGYGAGSHDYAGHPNVLRLLVGEARQGGHDQTISVVECEIDDMNPQLFGPLMDRLFAAGAVDVFYAAVQMKKNRPGTLVTVMVPPARRGDITGVLFAETTTIGVRHQEVVRECLTREFRSIQTSVGPIRFKVASRDGRVLNASPEFDDCARAAEAHGLAVKDVLALATRAWLDHGGGSQA
ncbi:MAG TPA: nickel pincer cofactor biosynthesis protein LarC [Vicinamibacterales bacterium]|nr:nickel pincer cofactor biosynthesis protein LarC [Vicinamibacterales bacterium]